MRKRLLRLVVFLAYGSGSLLLILVLLSVAVRIQDWIFRDRAERLFNDIESIKPLHTTFGEMESIVAQWHGSGSYEVPCSKQNCQFSFGMVEPQVKWRDNSRLFLMLLDFYRFLGGHPTIVWASVNVEDGVVSAKGYTLSVEAPPYVNSEGRLVTYSVQGTVSTVSQTNAIILGMPDARYQIGSAACLGCWEIHVAFSPFADAADVRRLSHINFSCLTRQHPCRTRSDIMPIATSERLKEGHFYDAPF
jgi:hypothetical protein